MQMPKFPSGIEVRAEFDAAFNTTRLVGKYGDLHMMEEMSRDLHKLAATDPQMAQHILQSFEQRMRQKIATQAYEHGSVLGELRAQKAQWMAQMPNGLEPKNCYFGQSTYDRMLREIGGPESFLHQEMHLNRTVLGMRPHLTNDDEHIGIGL